MNIDILTLIKEDLEKEGKNLKDFKLIEIKEMLKEYNNKINA